MVASTEIDVRLFGMVVALAVIWIGFHLLSGGDFLTARNLWNLSVQSASIAIMATGMVLIIVSRNIDLSVGSLLGFLGYTMAMAQTRPRLMGWSVYDIKPPGSSHRTKRALRMSNAAPCKPFIRVTDLVKAVVSIAPFSMRQSST